MASKRSLKRDVAELSEASHGDEPPLVMNLTGTGKDDDRHAALLTPSFPEKFPERESVAIPRLLPRRWWTERGFLFVVSCSDGGRYGIDPTEETDGSKTVFACDLWEDMTEEELAAEAEYRVENDEPLPELLEPYVSKE